MISEVKTDVKKLNDRTSKLESATTEIQAILNRAGAPIINRLPTYGFATSPMQPNENGRKLLQDSGFNELYPKIKDEVFKRLDGRNTRTLYDAEKNSVIVLSEMQNDLLFDSVKHYAVSHPNEPLELIFTISSWVIRDDYAKERNIEK